MQVKLQEISKEVWRHNYKAPKERSHKDTWERQAVTAASVEKKSIQEQIYNDFLWLLEDFNGVAGGRITANLGVEGREGTTLFNCFVHHPRDINYKDADSIHGIYDLLEAQALTLKSEGGYGTNISYLRPAGMYIEGIGVRTPGVLKFMELWDKSSEIITMGCDKTLGDIKENEKKKIRKGAQLGVMECWHPEIEDFVEAKQTQGRLTKFNLSVGITKGFMDAVINDKEWELKYPDTTHEMYETEWFGDIEDWEKKKYPVTTYKKVKAQELWDKIMHSTYTRNDPGVIFLDLANKLNTLSYTEKIVAGNPCSEILMPTGPCNLFSINVVKCIIKVDNNHYEFDYDKFKRAVTIAVRFSDNINDISRVPLPEYKKAIDEKRRIGIGVMGLGSLHYILGIRFASKESLKLIRSIFKTKSETEILASAKLGKEKGSFKVFNKKEYFNTQWWKTVPISKEVKEEVEKIGEMRNCHRSANAPTGNNSIYVGVVSGGIEPVYEREYVRWTIVTEHERAKLKEKGFKFPEVHKGEWFETKHLKFSKRGTDDILEGTFEDINYQVDRNRGLIKGSTVEDYGWKFVKENFSEERIKELEEQDIFVSTESLSVDEHISTLKIIAKFTDLNSSKTINIPKDYSYEDFKNVYFDAWKAGIKGITTYRQGTMTAVLEKKEEIKEHRELLEQTFIDAGDQVLLERVKLPDEYYSKGYIIHDDNGKKWYVNIAFADRGLTRPFALFVSTNSKESTEVADDTITSAFKLAKEKGIKKHIIDAQWEKLQGQSNVTKIARMLGFLLHHNIPVLDVVDNLIAGDFPFSSFPYHITRLLKKFVVDGTEVTGKSSKCPECKGQMIFQSGCVICKDCSWSKC